MCKLYKIIRILVLWANITTLIKCSVIRWKRKGVPLGTIKKMKRNWL